MSLTTGIAIFATFMLFVALIAGMFRGRSRQRLGPVNVGAAPGQPPVQQAQANQAAQDTAAVNLMQWIWIGISVAVLVVVLILIFVFWAQLIAAASGFGAYLASTTWPTLLTIAIIFLLVAYVLTSKTVRAMAVRGAIATAAVLLWFALFLPLSVAIFPCSSSDTACKQERAVKEEVERQRQARVARELEASRQPVAQQCSINRMPYRYESTKPTSKVNPGGTCAIALFIEGHCVYFTQNHREEPGGIICVSNGAVAVRDMRNATIDMPVDVDRVWSVGAAFDGDIGLWQPRYTQLFSWR